MVLGATAIAAVAGKLILKGALDMAGMSLMAGAGAGIWKMSRRPPEVVQVLMHGGVYPVGLKKSPVTFYERDTVTDTDGKQHEIFTYKMEIPLGKSLADFKTRLPALEDKFNCEVKMWLENGLACMKMIMKPLPDRLEFNESMYEALRKHECGVILGDSRNGLRIIDLAKPSTFSMLIGGVAGGGKSNLLNVIICGTACAYAPWDVQFYLVDMKDGVEFAPYENLPHVQSIIDDRGNRKRIIDNVDDCSSMLRSLADAIRIRNQLFKSAGVRNISEYRGLGYELPHIIVIADEFADFGTLDTQKRNKLFTEWGFLTRKGRSAGIHCIICTQIADADSVPRQLKGNLPVKVGFRMTKRENSETIFDSDVAIHIPPIPGRAVLKIGDYENIQVPLLETQTIEEKIIPQLEPYNEIMEEREAELLAEESDDEQLPEDAFIESQQVEPEPEPEPAPKKRGRSKANPDIIAT
jgi:S-DNA-T family DNA segregation ATPase FtsK/SpoIIIE